MKKLFFLVVVAAVVSVTGSANCDAGWLDSKLGAIGRGVSNAAQVAGSDISAGARHITSTPIRIGKPNFGYMRETLNHRPFANDTGELGRHFGGHSSQDLLIDSMKATISIR